MTLFQISNHRLRSLRELGYDGQPKNVSVLSKQTEHPRFEVPSDIDQSVIKAYYLQFDPGDDYHQRRDLTVLNGNGFITLPVPATFVIDKNSRVIAAHVEANYSERMSATENLEFLRNTY